MGKEIKNSALFLACFIATLIILQYSYAYQTENVFVVIIDGARYSETFGDEKHANIENMYNLRLEGCINTTFYNDKITKTLNGVNAIITGAWADFTSPEGKERPLFPDKPSIWEYYRKQLKIPQEKTYYSFPYSEDSGFQPISHHKEYGSNYWPMRGHNWETDKEKWEELKTVMDRHHPKLAVFYIYGPDGAGHQADWQAYIKAIQTADEFVGALWRKIQSDLIYQNKTALIVTNDHGRHDEAHGGFQHHGDDCDGCKHIMFLALGPDFKQNYKSDAKRTLIDIAPTIGKLLGFKLEYSTGEVMTELFKE